MMGTKTVSEVMDCSSILTWLIAQEDSTALSHCETFKFYIFFISLYTSSSSKDVSTLSGSSDNQAPPFISVFPQLLLLNLFPCSSFFLCDVFSNLLFSS
jgi:hypothetical protein